MSHVTPRTQSTTPRFSHQPLRTGSNKRANGPPKSLWNLSTERLLIFLVDGTQFNTKYPAEIKISPTNEKKPTFRTKNAKKSETPSWEEFFYLDFLPESLTFESAYGITTRDNLKAINEEVVIDEWMELKPKKEKHADKASGRIHVRYYLSTHPDLRQQRITNETVHYYLNHTKSIMKTGDLILYSGRGPIHESIKLQTGLPYSGIGMIIKLKNKYTHKDTLYILESTSNNDMMIDCFFEEKLRGVCLFKLRERLHHFHGPAAWLVRMEDESAKKMDVDRLVKWVTRIHTQRNLEDTFIQKPQISENMADFFRSWKIAEKNMETILDLYSPQIMLGALEAAKLIDSETIPPEIRQKATPVDVVKLEYYQSQKTLLFCVTSSLKHFGSSIPTVTLSCDPSGLELEDQELLKNMVAQFQISGDLVYEEGKIYEEGVEDVLQCKKVEKEVVL